MDADLRERLEAAVMRAMDRAAVDPMRWGVDDCALWCADVIREVCGYDPAETFRGRYDTRYGALKVLTEGWGGLVGALSAAGARHGWREIAADDAQPGDIGFVVLLVPHLPTPIEQMAIDEGGSGPLPMIPRTPATVICRAPGWFVGRAEKGFTALPARNVVKAWAIA